MELAGAFGVVIVISLALLVVAMYAGGGAEAVIRQAGMLLVTALALAGIAAIVFVAATRGGLLPIGVGLAALSAIVAGVLARSVRLAERSGRARNLRTALWVLAGFEALLASVGLWLLLS
jgi:hypothetical protein